MYGWGLRVDPQKGTGTPVWWHEAGPMEPLVCRSERSPKCYATVLGEPEAWKAMEHLRMVASRKYLL